MNNKTDIEEDIRLLEDYCQVLQGKHLDNRVRAIENILADREKYKQLYERALSDLVQADVKANKYDSLVKEIEDKIKELKNLKLQTIENKLERDSAVKSLQELLDAEKEEV